MLPVVTIGIECSGPSLKGLSREDTPQKITQIFDIKCCACRYMHVHAGDMFPNSYERVPF